MQKAREAEKEIMNDNYKGPLHGIPIGVKDNYKTKGIKSTAGAKIFKDYIPDYTATTVENLVDDGGIMLGKLNMHELGAGLTGYNPHFGASLNPWKTDYIPGASSSGSGAALAAGLATLATGSDTFGSIRTPASMSGVYGIKPTKGLLSTYGLFPGAWSLDHPGPMARTVPDLALMLHSMAGYDANDPDSLNVSIPDYTTELNKDIKGLKIGVPTYYLSGLGSEIESIFNNSLNKLKDLGAEIKEIDIPELSLVNFANISTLFGESSAYSYGAMQENPNDFGQDARVIYQTGSLISAQQYVKAQQARRKIIQAMNRVFEEVDLLLGPTSKISTPKFNDNHVEQSFEVFNQVSPFTSLVDLSGIPSLAVPMELDSNGIPAGMIFMGEHLSEKRLLQAGDAWEKINPLGLNYEELEINQ